MTMLKLLGMTPIGQYFIGEFDICMQSAMDSMDERVDVLEAASATYSSDYTSLNTRVTAVEGTMTGLKAVAFTGAYSDLTGKPSLATVATSGSYNDLSNKPSIPSAQVNSDWNSGSGVSQILNKPTIPSVVRTTSSLTLSLVGTGATGTQISATKDSTVRCTVTTSATATIAGAATSSVALKICATNSATEGDWTTVVTSETAQSYSLAIALQGVTSGKGQLNADVPAGWYVKLVNSGSGTHSETYLTGQKTIFG